MNVLLFAGASEGRELLRRLYRHPVRVTVSVATEYGKDLLEEFAGRYRLRAGRLDREAMRSLMRETEPDLTVDATHPYARDASANIRFAAAAQGVPLLRLLREPSPREDCLYVAGAKEAAEAVSGMAGNILLATGAKELAAFTAVGEIRERLYARVLPTVESLGKCVELGIGPGRIIAMRGPFSRELNLALFRQCSIAVMVTKDGGAEGGFPEKMRAARDAGVRAVVIGRPPGEEGLGLEAVLAAILKGTEPET